MLEGKPINQLLQSLSTLLNESPLTNNQLSQQIQKEGKQFQKSIESQAKRLIEEFLSDLDLVTREEFELQKKVLAKTRSKVDKLSTEIEKLENS